MKLFYRQNSMFKLDESKLEKNARTTQVINGLYAAVYDEFKGAIDNPQYNYLTPLQKMDKLNEFALKWLQDRGYNAKN